jgi:hypothetical protein
MVVLETTTEKGENARRRVGLKQTQATRRSHMVITGTSGVCIVVLETWLQ